MNCSQLMEANQLGSGGSGGAGGSSSGIEAAGADSLNKGTSVGSGGGYSASGSGTSSTAGGATGSAALSVRWDCSHRSISTSEAWRGGVGAALSFLTSRSSLKSSLRNSSIVCFCTPNFRRAQMIQAPKMTMMRGSIGCKFVIIQGSRLKDVSWQWFLKDFHFNHSSTQGARRPAMSAANHAANAPVMTSMV